jgi:hypothetical protein
MQDVTVQLEAPAIIILVALPIIDILASIPHIPHERLTLFGELEKTEVGNPEQTSEQEGVWRKGLGRRAMLRSGWIT